MQNIADVVFAFGTLRLLFRVMLHHYCSTSLIYNYCSFTYGMVIVFLRLRDRLVVGSFAVCPKILSPFFFQRTKFIHSLHLKGP